MASENTLWVVEMQVGVKVERWEPTVGVAFTRAEGKTELAQWCADNPSDQFRLRKYQRVEATNG